MDCATKVQHQHIPPPNLTTSQTRMPVEATQSPSPMTRWGDKTPDWMGMRGPDGDGTPDWLGMRDLDGDGTLDLGTRGPDWLASMDGGLLGMPVQGLQ